MQIIIRNMIKCNHCGDIIESVHRHDFVTCSCGKCSVDGGHDYLRRCFDKPGDYTEMSEVEPDDFAVKSADAADFLGETEIK